MPTDPKGNSVPADRGLYAAPAIKVKLSPWWAGMCETPTARGRFLGLLNIQHRVDQAHQGLREKGHHENPRADVQERLGPLC